jgi:hypothetical protein
LPVDVTPVSRRDFSRNHYEGRPEPAWNILPSVQLQRVSPRTFPLSDPKARCSHAVAGFIRLRLTAFRAALSSRRPCGAVSRDENTLAKITAVGRCPDSVSETGPEGVRADSRRRYNYGRRFSSTAFRPLHFPKEARFPFIPGLGRFELPSSVFADVSPKSRFPCLKVKTCEFPRTPFDVPSPLRSRSSFLDSEFMKSSIPIYLRESELALFGSGIVGRLRKNRFASSIFRYRHSLRSLIFGSPGNYPAPIQAQRGHN